MRQKIPREYVHETESIPKNASKDFALQASDSVSVLSALIISLLGSASIFLLIGSLTILQLVLRSWIVFLFA